MNSLNRKVRLPTAQNQVARHTRLVWRLHDNELFGHQKRNGRRLSFLNNPAAPGIPHSTLHPARCCRSLKPLKGHGTKFAMSKMTGREPLSPAGSCAEVGSSSVSRQPATPTTAARQHQQYTPEQFTQPFCDFMTQNPTPFHVVDYCKTKLHDAGFHEVRVTACSHGPLRDE